MTVTDHRPVGVLAGTLSAASGRHHREDPVVPVTGGPAGNAVLTAWTGLVLLVLFIAELLTLVDVRGLITWHAVLGALLIPPALLKTGATMWRMVGYYRGADTYHQAGPPPLLLRLLGPLVVLSTLALLATGVLLVVLGQEASRHTLVALPFLRVDWVSLHQGTFVVWAAVTGLHLIGRLVPALQIAFRRRPEGRLPGRVGRYVAGGSLVVLAAPLAILVAHLAASW